MKYEVGIVCHCFFCDSFFVRSQECARARTSALCVSAGATTCRTARTHMHARTHARTQVTVLTMMELTAYRGKNGKRALQEFYERVQVSNAGLRMPSPRAHSYARCRWSLRVACTRRWPQVEQEQKAYACLRCPTCVRHAVGMRPALPSLAPDL